MNTPTIRHTPAVTTVLQRVRSDSGYGAFVLLYIGYVVLPLWMGIDKYAKVLTDDWPGYLAPWIVDLLPFSAQTAMYVVGAVEILAAFLVAIKPRYASFVVAAWLAGIIINLLTYSGFYDVALRDFGLLIGALALAALAARYDSPWTQRSHSGVAVTKGFGG
jgi:hypothetical protein